MRFIVGSKSNTSANRSANAARVASRRANPAQENPTRRPYAIWPFAPYTIDPFASKQCYRGVNGQMVCPLATAVARPTIAKDATLLRAAGACVWRNGQWICP